MGALQYKALTIMKNIITSNVSFLQLKKIEKLFLHKFQDLAHIWDKKMGQFLKQGGILQLAL